MKFTTLIHPYLFLLFFFLSSSSSFFSGAHALTLFVQTPTAAGAPALVVWTRDAAVDGAGELRFDLRFVGTGNATSSSASATTITPASASVATPTPTTDSSATPTQENSFVVQARADGDASTSTNGNGSDAGLALANIRLAAGASAGSANVFFPAGGQYVVTAVSGPSNSPIGTSNSITVTESTAVTAAASGPLSGTPSSSAPTPTTAPALTTITPSTPSSTAGATSTPSSSDHASPISATAATKKHPNLPAIIGGVLGTLVALALIATLVFLVGRRRALREKRRLTFHREWMVQSSESVRNLNVNGRNGGNGGGESDTGHGHTESESGHGHGHAGMAGVGVGRRPSAGAGPGAGAGAGMSRNLSTTARPNTNTAGLLVPPSPFICVTPPPEDDLETGLARNTVASSSYSRGTQKKLRLHTYTGDTDASPTTTTPNTNANTNYGGTRPLPAGAAPPTMYTPTMLANARTVANSMTMTMPTPMRQTSTTPLTTLARMSSLHAHPGASPMGPRAPSPSVTIVTPTSPFPPQLPPLNLGFGNGAYAAYEAGGYGGGYGAGDEGRKPPASAPARTMSFPVKTVTAVRMEAGVGRAVTVPSKGKAPLINTLATRPASPRLPAAATSSSSSTNNATATATVTTSTTTSTAAAPTPTPANRKTPRQHVLAARLAILQNQMAEILSAPDSVHSSLVLADMRRQVAWIAEHERGDWAMGRTDERPAGWARVMTP